MQSPNISPSRTLYDVAPPAHPSNDAAASSADPAGFASLLRQSQSQAAASAPPALAGLGSTPRGALGGVPDTIARGPDGDGAPKTDGAPAKPQASDSSDESAQASAQNEVDAKTQARTIARAKLRGADGGGTPETDATRSAQADAAPAPADAGAGAKPAKAATDPALDPSVMQWLAALQRPAPDTAAKATGEAATDTGAATAADNPSALLAAAGKHVPSAAELKAEADLKDKITADSQHFASVLDQAGSEAVAGDKSLADAVAAAAALPKSNVEALGAAAAAAASAGLGKAAGEIGTSAAPVSVAIATPVEAPEFAQALGMQLSMLTRDGVQEAELHLNPADMGPVSVQIVMDGTQARIDFGADVAATRQAIEAGLPALASALRDAGFTLAGGGVSQQSGQRSDGGGSANPRGQARGGNAAQGIEADARVSRSIRRVALGAVDLYA